MPSNEAFLTSLFFLFKSGLKREKEKERAKRNAVIFNAKGYD
jgi:hypothetical protein